MIEIDLLLLFMIVAALIAVEVKDLLSSVIAIGAVGIGLSMAFLVLKAPDLAMMQLVVEILSLIILIRATTHVDVPFSTSGRWLSNTVSTAVFTAAFLGLAYFPLSQIQAFGEPLARVSKTYITEGFALTGTKNIVAAITANFRALDTLGEVTALFACVIGVLAVSRSREIGDIYLFLERNRYMSPISPESKGMTLIVKTATCLTAGFILLYGIYVSLSGHISPGGGFAGGVIVALLLAQVMLAFGKEVSLRWLHADTLHAAMAVGGILFLCAVMLGRPNWVFNNEFIMPLCETVVVGAGMFSIFVALVLLSKSDRDAE